MKNKNLYDLQPFKEKFNSLYKNHTEFRTIK